MAFAEEPEISSPVHRAFMRAGWHRRMKVKATLVRVLSLMLALAPSAFAGKIGTACHPMSLLGTDLTAKPLADEPEMPVMIVSQPSFMTDGSFFEIAGLVGIPHHLAQTPDNFPRESNLVLLLGVKVMGSERRSPIVSFDLSEVTEAGLKKYGVSMEQLVKLLVHCMAENIRNNDEQKNPLLSWLLPAFAKGMGEKLPRRLHGKP